MALAGGLSAQAGIADETTYGTGVTPSRFLEFNDESIKRTIERIESAGLRPSRRVLREKQWVPGREAVAGDIEFDVQTNGFGLPIKHMLGEIATSKPNVGSAPNTYEHLGTVGGLDSRSLTLQVARGDSGGTIRAFTYAGVKVAKWEIVCDEDGLLKLKWTIDGASEVTSTALATASYASTAQLLAYTGGLLKLGGSEVIVKQFSLAGDNGLMLDRYGMKATTPQQQRNPLEGDKLREYTGKITMEFESLTQYERFTAGTIAELTAAFTGPEIEAGFKNALEITLPGIRIDGETPNVGGEGIIELTLPFKVVDTAAGNGPVQMKYRTTDTTP